MKMWKLVAIIMFGSSTTSAMRVDSDKVLGQILEVKKQTESQAVAGFGDVEAFATKISEICPQGVVAGKLALNLEKGVAATVATSTFTREEDDSFKLEVFHKHMDRPVSNVGEIATPSKVPIMWALDSKTVYHFAKSPPQDDGSENGRWRLKVEGIKLVPFGEGKQMYDDSGAAEACKAEAEKGLVAQVQCERGEFFQWYKTEYKRAFKTKDYKDYTKNPSHKLGRILGGMYGGRMTYSGIRMGGSGDEAWEKILYSMVTIPPTAPRFFEIFDNSDNPDQLEMGMVSVPQLSGQYGWADHDIVPGQIIQVDINCADYKDLDFSEKNPAEFDASAFESQRSKGERLARSGLNFGALVAKGRDLEDDRVRGGTAKYIINFASPCTKSKSDSNHDPTDGCQKDNGRVYWHPPKVEE